MWLPSHPIGGDPPAQFATAVTYRTGISDQHVDAEPDCSPDVRSIKGFDWVPFPLERSLARSPQVNASAGLGPHVTAPGLVEVCEAPDRGRPQPPEPESPARTSTTPTALTNSLGLFMRGSSKRCPGRRNLSVAPCGDRDHHEEIHVEQQGSVRSGSMRPSPSASPWCSWCSRWRCPSSR